MPTLTDLPVVRRLNARTRSAATRRRRLRKAASAVCAAAAVVIALDPASGHTPAGRHHEAGQLAGRHVMSLPADPALVAALAPTSTVDVWDHAGHRIASRAPILPPPSGRSTGTAPSGDRSHVLAGLRPEEMRRVLGLRSTGQETDGDVVVTLSV